MIDTSIKYTATCFIKRKKEDLVVHYIYQIRVVYFGVLFNFYCDCGRELANYVFCEMYKKIGIETSTTAGES